MTTARRTTNPTGPDRSAMPRRTPRAALGVLALVVALVMAVAAACGSADPPREISQTVQFTATEYAFSADASTTISAGEFVRVEFVNEGTLVHEMQVLDGRGRLIDRVIDSHPERRAVSTSSSSNPASTSSSATSTTTSAAVSAPASPSTPDGPTSPGERITDD